MELGLPTALDNLASGGIIDFDAHAYLKNEKPRYGIPPQMIAPQLQVNSKTKIQEQPLKDEFKNSNIKTAGWKKTLAAVLFAGLAIFGLAKIKPLKKLITKPVDWIKNIKIKKP